MRTAASVVVGLIFVLALALPSNAQDPGWPRQHTQNGNTLVIYQPQVDNWNNFSDLDWRMAISLTPEGEKPVVGVVVLKGETLVDHDTNTVLISSIEIVRTNFPSLDPVKAEQMDQLTRTFLPKTVSISLQRLVACVPKKGSAPGVQLKSTPPVIFVSYSPAILLDVDGQPVRGAIQNSNLEFVVNTHWPLFFDPQSSMFYLLAGQQWLTSSALAGPWSATKDLPSEMDKVPNQAQWADLKNFIPPPPAQADAVVPTVYFSSTPADIILFDGKPVYTQIPGTQLQYAANTVSYVFLYTPTNTYYYLTAGRWFSAAGLGGPWTFATPNLPADFAQIPRDNPAAQVLASVPGTDEAEDAVLMAQIPTTVTVDPKAAAKQASVTYDGDPKFAPIDGTSLSYATNTAQKVIKVGDLYYLCLQGIWFVSTSAEGPWQTASSVPSEIYTIPTSSPVYNVTYVTQVTTSDGNVQSSYTSGYLGVFVLGLAAGAIIADGTGYYYPPYVAVYPAYAYPAYRYPVYYPPPYTYGASSYYYSSTGAYGVSQTAYGPYGSATRAASYNPYTGTYARGASVSNAYGTASAGRAYNPYTGARAEGASVSNAYGTAAAGRAYNPYTGASAATRQGSNAYSSWGSSVVSKGGQSAYTQHYSTAQGSVGSVQTSSGGRAVGANTAYGSTTVGKTANNNLYAGHDGNVYKNTGDGWQKYDDGGWSSFQTPTQTAQQQAQARSQTAQQQAQSRAQSAQQSGFSRDSFQQQATQRSSSFSQRGGNDQIQSLQQEAQNRQRGEQSSQRFQDFQSSGFGSSGLGSRSGGSFGGSFSGGRGGFRR